MRKRLLYLVLGQLVSAVGIVALVQADVGLDPWNCLNQGLELVTGLSFGVCTMLVGVAAVAISFLLRETLGWGTIVNVLCPGLLIDLIQRFQLIPKMHGLWSGMAMLIAGEIVVAWGTYYCMAAEMGAGPRDALMVAVAKPLRISPGLCRTGLEVLAVLSGWAMGAKVGIGTVFSACTFGFFIQKAFDLFHYDAKAAVHMGFPETAEVFRQWRASRGTP